MAPRGRVVVRLAARIRDSIQRALIPTPPRGEIPEGVPDLEANKCPMHADPLDGWGRPKERLPGRWRRLNATSENLFSGNQVIYQYVCWNQHLNGGCDEGGWAREVDRRNGNDWLCGRHVPEQDPLGGPTITHELGRSTTRPTGTPASASRRVPE